MTEQPCHDPLRIDCSSRQGLVRRAVRDPAARTLSERHCPKKRQNIETAGASSKQVARPSRDARRRAQERRAAPSRPPDSFTRTPLSMNFDKSIAVSFLPAISVVEESGSLLHTHSTGNTAVPQLFTEKRYPL